jgi:hypothetical protein
MSDSILPMPSGQKIAALEQRCRELEARLAKVQGEKDVLEEKLLVHRLFGEEDVEEFIEQVRNYPSGDWCSMTDLLAELEALQQPDGREAG